MVGTGGDIVCSVTESHERCCGHSELLPRVVFRGPRSGGVLQDSVGEDSSFENKNKLVMPVESSAGGLSELEHHCETELPRAAALRTVMPQADRREGAVDRAGCPQVTPVLGEKVVEGEEGIPVAAL